MACASPRRARKPLVFIPPHARGGSVQAKDAGVAETPGALKVQGMLPLGGSFPHLVVDTPAVEHLRLLDCPPGGSWGAAGEPGNPLGNL